jgi:hypothetical protein
MLAPQPCLVITAEPKGSGKHRRLQLRCRRSLVMCATRPDAFLLHPGQGPLVAVTDAAHTTEPCIIKGMNRTLASLCCCRW